MLLFSKGIKGQARCPRV